MASRSPELAVVVGEDGPDRNPQRFVEEQDAVVGQVARGDRHLGVLDLGEGERTEDVDDNLDIDLAATL